MISRDVKRYKWPAPNRFVYTLLSARIYKQGDDGVIRRRTPKPHADVSGRQRRKLRKIETKYCASLVQMAIDNASPGHTIIDAQP